MSKGRCWENKEPKYNILEDIMLYDGLKATGWRAFVTRKTANQ